MSQDLTGKHGESPPSEAQWGYIDDPDSRLQVPTDILKCTHWYTTGKRCEVLIELREPGSIFLHRGSLYDDIEQKRKGLLEELGDKAEAIRRITLSKSMFIRAAFGKTNRRITLSAEVLAHLGIGKPARVLCLAYLGNIEVLSEQRARILAETTRMDINLGDPEM
jgi:hypothetical protein